MSSSELQNILGLAQARELLLIDQNEFMPKGAATQRAGVLHTIEQTIDATLAAHPKIKIPSEGSAEDELSNHAIAYLRQRQKAPITPVAEKNAYAHLKKVFDGRANFLLAESTLSWLRNSHSLQGRVSNVVVGNALAAIAVFNHRLIMQPEIPVWLAEVKSTPEFAKGDEWIKRNVAMMDRQWFEETGLEEKLVHDLSIAESKSGAAWAEARKNNDFGHWLPSFKELVRLTRIKAQTIADKLGCTPYEALLNHSLFNPGMNADRVDALFDELKRELPPLIKQAQEKQAGQTILELPPVPIEKQQAVARRIMRELGLEEEYSRLDTSVHPFSSGRWQDVRITSRYDENKPLDSLAAAIHETGHALYSRGLPIKHKGEPVGYTHSIWLNESQALLWENQIGHSREFMTYLSGILKQEWGNHPAYNADNLYKVINRVKPDFIRTQADEVTYPMHVILRHDIEKKLIEGMLEPEQVPAAWNKGMKELLGIDVPTDAKGCLQDIHWGEGYFGYFPSYTLGALAAAQQSAAMKKNEPGIMEDVANGNFDSARNWVRTHIHSQGSYYSGDDLLRYATGQTLSVKPFIDHIKERYLGEETEIKRNWTKTTRRPSGQGASAVGA